MKLGLVYNAKQAKLLIHKKVKADAFLSFCPEAKYYLNKAGKHVITSMELYGPALHARTAVIAAQELEKVVAECKNFYGLRYGESRSLRVYLYYFLSTAYYVYYCIAKAKGDFSGYYWVEGNKVRSTNDFDRFVFQAIQQAASGVDSYSKTNYSYINYLFAKRLNRTLVERTAKHSRIRLIDFVNPATRHIVKALIEMDRVHVSFSLRWVGINVLKTWSIYRKACAFLEKSNPDLNEPVPLFKAIDPRKYNIYARNILEISIKNPHIRRLTLHKIARFVPVLRAEYAFGMEVAALVDANVNIGDHAMYPTIRGAVEQMHHRNGEKNISVMVNHGTHNLQPGNRISALVQRSWASQDRLLTESTTIFIPKSPLTLALAKVMYPDFTYQVRSVRIFSEVEPKAYKPGEDFVILHAGNYTEVHTRIGWMHIPWCRETSFEYVAQILEFIEQIKDMRGIKLIVKLKPFKFDPHYIIIKEQIEKLGMTDRVTLDTSVDFTDIMKTCHLLVSNLSTTMEESVPNNIPTLLYTYRKKYFHLPCSHEPASASNRSLIYGAKRKEDVVPLVQSIMAHHNELLRQKNTGIGWQKEDFIDAVDIAREIATLVD